MFVLGVAGGLDAIHEETMDTPENYTYDGAAVLVEDGVVVAAIEEDRLDRIKHSNKFPARAIQFCLDQAGLRLEDLDRIAYYVDEPLADALLARMYLARPAMQHRVNARTLLRMTLGRAFGAEVDPSKLCFYEHKLTHAACAMHQSGFDESLVYVIDNAGGIYTGRRDDDGLVSLETLALTPPAKSLQTLCQAVLPFLGLGMFEEYKALALAPYGDPAPFEPLMSRLYQLLPDGDYELSLKRAFALMGEIEPRSADGEMTSQYQDLAASLQQAMERIVLHVLEHFRRATGLANLCMAGGMSENTDTNGRVLYSGLFDDVFVHPVAYDSGCAIGAALLASQDAGRPAHPQRVRSVAWGSSIGDSSEVAAQLSRWSGFLETSPCEDAARRTAQVIADGGLVAWVQGRSDFGSHALGRRNVLADPRQMANRERLHRALGRKETYRPLAALILAEDLREWCNLPPGIVALPFQNFGVQVLPDKREQLAAAMQKDGSARLQTVTAESNPQLWALIREFGESTGTAALLSASFNRSMEPAAESIEDAVTSFLNSGLDHLVVGDQVAGKAADNWRDYLSLRASLPPFVQVIRTKGLPERRRGAVRDEIRTTYSPGTRIEVSQAMGDLLLDLNEETPVGDLLGRVGADTESERSLMTELLDLWSQGMIVLVPAKVEEPA